MTSDYNLNFLGNDTFIKNEAIFNNFDINYLPIQNLPLSYYNLASRLSYSNIILEKNDNNEKQITINDISKIEKEINFNDNYNYIKIKENTNIKVNFNLSDCSLLLVGGGGGGNDIINGGGGGGGQIREFTNINLNEGDYSIIIGNGGSIKQSGENTSIKYNTNIIYDAKGGSGSADNNGGNSFENLGGNSYYNNGGGGGGNNFNNINNNIKSYFEDDSINDEEILKRFNYIGVSGKKINNYGKELYLGGGGNGGYNNTNNFIKHIYQNSSPPELIYNYHRININNENDLKLSKDSYKFTFSPDSININNYIYKNNYILPPSDSELKLWLKFDKDFLKNNGSLNVNINNSNCVFDNRNYIRGSGSLFIPYKNNINTTFKLSPFSISNYSTFCLWLYIKKTKSILTPNSIKNIFCFKSTENNEIGIKFKAISNNENKLIFTIFYSSYNNLEIDNKEIGFRDENFGKWNNIVWIINNDTKYFKIYFNNSLVLDNIYSIIPINVNNNYNNNFIGDIEQRTSIIKSEIDINLSDFRYYNRLLTNKDVNIIYSGYISLYYNNKEINLKGGGGRSGKNGIKNTGGGGGGGVSNNINEYIEFIDNSYNINSIPSINTPSKYDYYISFTNVGTSVFKLNKDFLCDILIIGGGGGGGGKSGGGGGAGGVVYMINKIMKKETYKIIVGAGGLPRTDSNYNTNGDDSKIMEYINDKILNYDNIDLIGKGGGRAGEGNLSTYTERNGYNGGSGGGSGKFIDEYFRHFGSLYRNTGGIATQGNTYWNGRIYVAGGSNGLNEAGGANGGGIEIENNITGINITYAKGGYTDRDDSNIDGIDNTGNGGGSFVAANFSDKHKRLQLRGRGGSGIVIIRFKDIHEEKNNNGGSGLVIIKYPKNSKSSLLTNANYTIINNLGYELDINLKKLNNIEKPYNRFNIGEMRMVLIIIWIIIILFILRYLSYHFPEFYIYFIISIIILILLLSSLWFLYVGNELIL